jgi:N4-gp56 family major capsid protein
MPLTGTYAVSADLAGTIQFALQRRVIPVVRQELMFAQFAQEGRIEQGSDRLRFVKIGDVAEVSTTLPDEISNPSVEALPLFSFVEITPVEIGRLWGLSRREQNISAFDMVNLARDRIAYDAARRIDTIVRDVLFTGGVVMYAAGRASRAALTAPDVLKMNDARLWLIKRDAADLPARDMVAVTHPFVVGDLMNDTTAVSGWQPLHQYSPDAIFNGEIGRAYGTRFVTTTRAKTVASTVTVYVTFVGIGPWAIGTAALQDLQFRFVDGPDKSDPLNRTTLIGYYMDFGAGLLDTTRYIRFESAATTV